MAFGPYTIIFGYSDPLGDRAGVVSVLEEHETAPSQGEWDHGIGDYREGWFRLPVKIYGVESRLKLGGVLHQARPRVTDQGKNRGRHVS